MLVLDYDLICAHILLPFVRDTRPTATATLCLTLQYRVQFSAKVYNARCNAKVNNAGCSGLKLKDSYCIVELFTMSHVANSTLGWYSRYAAGHYIG